MVPVIRSCQSPIWIWLVNYLHLHLHLQGHTPHDTDRHAQIHLALLKTLCNLQTYLRMTPTMQRELRGSRYAAWPGSRPLPTLQPASHVRAHPKGLEAADEDYHEAVDEDDVECALTPHACTNLPTCAAHHGQDVQLRPSPLARAALGAHADAFPVFPPPLRAGAHSCCLPTGVHMTTIRCVPFVQRQHGTLCLAHAFDDMLQQRFLRHPDMCPAFPPGQAREGNYHVHELHRALQHISPHMPSVSVVEGHPHMGATDHTAVLDKHGYIATVHKQPSE